MHKVMEAININPGFPTPPLLHLINIMKKHHHFLIISLPAQGHINPTLQLAKTLARTGSQVTFATTVYGLSQIKSLPTFPGLSFASFSDGYDDENATRNLNRKSYFSDLGGFSSRTCRKLIQTLAGEGRPVTCLIYTVLLPWAGEIARDMDIPSVFFAIQSATSFAIYHRYFNSHDGFYDGVREIDPLISIKLPDLPLFSSEDLPTFLLPTSDYFSFSAPVFHEHIKILEQDSKPFLLINTFKELEETSIKAVENMNVIPIGPLLPSAFSDGNDQTDKSVGGDLFESQDKDYLLWLDTKAESSVVYVSFGSMLSLKKEEKLELLHGLEETRIAYLIVLRKSEDEDEEVKELMEKGLSGEGNIVPWCSQMEVLCHKSIGCFITHCGWNSTLESLVAGVPLVGCPHISDQTTNAKMIEEVWGVGIRAKANGRGVVDRKEIKRCVDVLMGGGEEGEEIRRNAAKWRGLAMEGVKENGSSYKNLNSFLESLG